VSIRTRSKNADNFSERRGARVRESPIKCQSAELDGRIVETEMKQAATLPRWGSKGRDREGKIDTPAHNSALALSIQIRGKGPIRGVHFSARGSDRNGGSILYKAGAGKREREKRERKSVQARKIDKGSHS